MLKPAWRYVPIIVVLVAILPVFVLHSSQSSAAPEAAIWSAVNIPADGNGGKWQLANGYDVKLLTTARDGTLYAYAPYATNYTIFKSTDNGLSWILSGQVSDAMVALNAAPDDAGVIYYASNTTVYKSSNAGANFSTIAINPGGAGSDNVSITCLAVAYLGNARIIAAGTKDRDPGQFGGVYTLNESEPGNGWFDTGLRDCDLAAVAFSTNYVTDRQLIAVGSTENGTVVSFRNGNSIWGAASGNATINGTAPENAVIALPSDYDGIFFIGLATGNNSGDVFQINRLASPNVSTVLNLYIAVADNLSGIDISGLAVSGSSGSYYLVAGAAAGIKIYLSANGGQTWTRSLKEPSGENSTRILMSSDFAASRRVYAGTSGIRSAFSYSIDAGQTWNQLSLIDTTISDITDFAVSPRYGQDNTLLLLTWGGEHSLWRSQNSGANWERVYTANLGGADSFSHLEISPQYGASGSVVVLAGSSGQGAIWKSSDGGQTFIRRVAGFPIDTLVLGSNENYFVGSYNGTYGLLYRTSDSGVSYSAPTVVGPQPLNLSHFPQDFSKTRLSWQATLTDGFIYRLIAALRLKQYPAAPAARL